MTTVSLMTNEVQLFTLKLAIETEIKSYHTTKLRLTREPALRIFKRLIGEPLGLPAFRGLRGLYQALQIVDDFLGQIEESKATPEAV